MREQPFRKRLLIVDDLLATRLLLTEILKAPDRDIWKAGSPEEAKNLLGKYWVMCAIIDKRLVNAQDSHDVSGLKLIEEMDDSIPVILYSEHRNESDFNQSVLYKKKIVRYVDAKDQGSIDEMRMIVDQVLAEHVQINFDLAITYQGITPEGIATTLLGQAPSGKQILEWAYEVDGLLRKMFARQQSITVSPLHVREGPVLVLRVLYETLGGVAQAIIECGPCTRMEQELKQAIRHKDSLEHQWKLDLKDWRSYTTLHFAGLLYRPARDTFWTSISPFYHYAELPAIESLLGAHFEHTCPCTNPEPASQPLSTYYRDALGVAPDDESLCLTHAIDTLCAEGPALGFGSLKRARSQLAFQLPNNHLVTCTDPCFILDHANAEIGVKGASALIHAGYPADTILISTDARSSRLVGPGFIRRGPILADLVALEAWIRWDLVHTRDMGDLYAFEQILTQPETFTERLEWDTIPLPQDLYKAARVIYRLRCLAGERPFSSLHEYRVGLFFHALKRIAEPADLSPDRQRPLQIRRAHALLASALLADRLTTSGPIVLATEESLNNAPYKADPFRVDEQNQVWKRRDDGMFRRLDLSERLLAAFLCLILTPNQPVSYDTLIGAVWRPEAALEDSTLARVIRRLRTQIGDDPANPQYIINKRAFGYILRTR